MPFANILVLASVARTTSGDSGPIAVPFDINYLAFDVNVTVVTGTTPTLDLFVERQGLDGIWYIVFHPTQIIATGSVSASLGPGDTAAALTETIRLRWAIGGTTPSFTFSSSIVGR